MLGESIGEMKGKISSQRVPDVDGPTMETNVSASGSLKGVQVNETLTYVASPSSNGVLHGVGNGIIMTSDGQMAIYTGEGIGRFDSSNKLNWRGAIFFKTTSTGKLEFLNNLVGVFEAQVDANGNFADKTWEWKKHLQYIRIDLITKLDPERVFNPEAQMWQRVIRNNMSPVKY